MFAVTTTLRITVDDMTYRDLFQFADLARASHIDPSKKVDWVLPFVWRRRWNWTATTGRH